MRRRTASMRAGVGIHNDLSVVAVQQQSIAGGDVGKKVTQARDGREQQAPADDGRVRCPSLPTPAPSPRTFCKSIVAKSDGLNSRETII